MNGQEYEVLIQGVRALFYIGVPVVIATSVLGTLAATFQAATTIHEATLSYAARLLALAIVLYLLFPAFARTCVNLAELAYR